MALLVTNSPAKGTPFFTGAPQQAAIRWSPWGEEDVVEGDGSQVAGTDDVDELRIDVRASTTAAKPSRHDRRDGSHGGIGGAN